MTLFNFELTDNYSNITKNVNFKGYFKKAIIVCLITLSLGIIIGYYFGSGITFSAVKYVVDQSASAHMVATTENSDFMRFIGIFFNNLLIAGLLLIIPIHFWGIVRKHTDNWTKKSYLTSIKPQMLTYSLITFQMIFIGNFIGFAIPIINNIVLVIASLFPHGIIEIPTIVLSGAVGATYANKDHLDFKFSFNDVLNFFVRVVLPLILLSAFIETYITPIFMSLA